MQCPGVKLRLVPYRKTAFITRLVSPRLGLLDTTTKVREGHVISLKIYSKQNDTTNQTRHPPVIRKVSPRAKSRPGENEIGDSPTGSVAPTIVWGTGVPGYLLLGLRFGMSCRELPVLPGKVVSIPTMSSRSLSRESIHRNCRQISRKRGSRMVRSGKSGSARGKGKLLSSYRHSKTKRETNKHVGQVRKLEERRRFAERHVNCGFGFQSPNLCISYRSS
jgi:hypothetical protein